MPLQNRVTPDKNLVAERWRGTFMGNRGGRIHDPVSKNLLMRKWASRRWIICVTEFKSRQREVMGKGYTELFFLDEVSALAAGHRPCYECRRNDAKRFAELWQRSFGEIAGSVADQMDRVLHNERLAEFPLLSPNEIRELPDGAMIRCGIKCLAKFGGEFKEWSGEGYRGPVPTPLSALLLTPVSTLEVLKSGYIPAWHESIG